MIFTQTCINEVCSRNIQYMMFFIHLIKVRILYLWWFQLIFSKISDFKVLIKFAFPPKKNVNNLEKYGETFVEYIFVLQNIYLDHICIPDNNGCFCYYHDVTFKNILGYGSDNSNFYHCFEL